MVTNDPTLAAFHEPSGDDLISYDHVMIDIESMSLSKHNALILSVGMIEFNPESAVSGLMVGARSLLLPSIEQQLLLGREVSRSTQKFWRDQPREASEHWSRYAGERLSLAATCRLIKLFCQQGSRVWANGTQFDLTNLEVLNEQLGDDGQNELWHYQKPRDMRTFVRENPATRLIPTNTHAEITGVPHEPVYDCVSQAWAVWEHWPNG